MSSTPGPGSSGKYLDAVRPGTDVPRTMEERRFTRFRPTAEPERMVFTVPEDGMCLSTFLLLHPRSDPHRVLVGRLDPNASWGHLGALDARRAAHCSKGWMLPSSQLVQYETPEASAHRIAREQLGVELATLPAPILMSDSEHRAGAPAGDRHWDIGFVYRLEGPATPPAHPAWSELRYLEVGKTPRGDFVRAQGDVLELAGVPPAD